MIARSTFLALALFGLAPGVGFSQVISYYNFNTLTNPVSLPIAASQGNGTLTSNFNRSGNTGVTTFTGTTVNALAGNPAGEDLALQGSSTGANPVNNNGQNITFTADTTGFADISVSFAAQRSSTGFIGNLFEYSTNGGANFTTFTAFTANLGSYTTQTFDLSAITALDNNPNVVFRITFNSATSGDGNNRIDNLQVTGVPEPSTMILTGLGVLGAGAYVARRRRQEKQAAPTDAAI